MNKSAEEILKPYIKNVKTGFGLYEMIDLRNSIKAMEEYANQKKNEWQREAAGNAIFWADSTNANATNYGIAAYLDQNYQIE